MGLGRIEKRGNEFTNQLIRMCFDREKRGIYSAAHVDKQTQETREWKPKEWCTSWWSRKERSWTAQSIGWIGWQGSFSPFIAIRLLPLPSPDRIGIWIWIWIGIGMRVESPHATFRLDFEDFIGPVAQAMRFLSEIQRAFPANSNESHSLRIAKLAQHFQN